MEKITIDGIEYDWNDLSDTTREILVSINAVDKKLKFLQNETAIALTAKKAYLLALKDSVAKKSIKKQIKK